VGPGAFLELHTRAAEAGIAPADFGSTLEKGGSDQGRGGADLRDRAGVVAQIERKFISEGQQARIEAAKAKGVYKGRKPSIPVERVREMRSAGHGATAIAKTLGISRMSVHRALTGA
jgi:DNA invertase Pin-like site-specific DNA recombinase